jgi:hypothetical protein
MKTALASLIVLVVLTALLDGASTQQAVTTQETTVPSVLCVPAVSQADFTARFDDATRRRWDDSYAIYRKWLRSVEILEFLGTSEENQTFLTAVRNVTPDDEVFLRVRRANPLLYSYSVKVERNDRHYSQSPVRRSRLSTHLP